MNRSGERNKSSTFERLRERLPVTVTQISPQKNNPQRVSLFHNGEFLLGVDQQTCLECRISVGIELTGLLIERVEVLEGYHSAKSKAYDYLSRRDHASGEIRDKLLKKGFSTEVTDQVVESLTLKGYLDDSGFAEKYAVEKSRLNRWGRRKIESELVKKGVPQDIVKKGMETALSGLPEEEICLDLILKRKEYFHRELNPAKRKQKIFRYLSARGFSASPISRAVQQFDQETDV